MCTMPRELIFDLEVDVAAITASRCLGTFDWRDVAEIVNAVLEADDRIPGEAS